MSDSLACQPTKDELEFLLSLTDSELEAALLLMPPNSRSTTIQAMLDLSDETDSNWEEWLQRCFPHVCVYGFGERHRRLWNWFDGLQDGQPRRPRVEAWPRGGAKSSTCELGCVRVAVKLTRRFVLYVCETQDQADKHVQAIGEYLSQIGIARAIGVYGHSKGWRRNQLRTET